MTDQALHTSCMPTQALVIAEHTEIALVVSKAPSRSAPAHMHCCSSACRHWAQVDWDKAAIQALLYQRYPDLIETYMRLRHPAMRADLAKFMILHT